MAAHGPRVSGCSRRRGHGDGLGRPSRACGCYRVFGLCMTGWPDARIGVAVNVGLLLLLAIGARMNLAVLTP